MTEEVSHQESDSADDMNPGSPSTPFEFKYSLSLPAEIRVQVYDEVLEMPDMPWPVPMFATLFSVVHRYHLLTLQLWQRQFIPPDSRSRLAPSEQAGCSRGNPAILL